MNISGYEKLSMVDYPKKLACTVFTYGCNMRCPFCHNAALVTGAPPPFIPQTEIFDYLEKRKKMLDAVCISGGEPTLQKDLPQFIKEVKQLGLLVKLDTNGTNPQILRGLIDSRLVDYVAMDIKNSPEKYPQTAGSKNIDFAAVKECIDLLINGQTEYEFRTTLIDKYHTESDILQIGKLLSGAKVLYLQRFKDTGGCISQGLSQVPLATAEYYKKLLVSSSDIKSVLLRNY